MLKQNDASIHQSRIMHRKNWKACVSYGYHGVQNVSVKTMVVQDVLCFFRNNPAHFKKWRCCISNWEQKYPIIVNTNQKLVVLCPIFLECCHYDMATNVVHEHLEEHVDRIPPPFFERRKRYLYGDLYGDSHTFQPNVQHRNKWRATDPIEPNDDNDFCLH